MLKKHTYKSQNTCHSFVAHSLLQILKKHTYKSENTWHSFFVHSLFQILKKRNYKSENTWNSFFAHSPFQILKKHTYESQNTPFDTNNNNNNFKGNNLHKNHHTYNFVIINQTNKYKAKIYNPCMYTQIIIKKISVFFYCI